MSNPKHTPGPWVVDDNAIVKGKGHGRYAVALNVNHAEDARLISAAPELLEALEIAVAQLDRDGHDLNKLGFLKQTINKAKGGVK